MIRLRMTKFNMILIEKLQKYQTYHQAELISMNILQVKKYYLLLKNIEQQNRLNLLIFHWEKLLKNKQGQLKIKEKTNRSNSKSRKSYNNKKYTYNDEDSPLISKQK